MVKPRPLTPRQERFVAEYLKDLNATQATIRAGYSPKGAEVTGSQLLRNPKVSVAVAKAMERRSAKTEITQDRVLAELSLLAFSDVTHYAVDAAGNVTLAPGAPPGAHRAISSIRRRITTDAEGKVTADVELRLWDKPAPLKLAGRHIGLFPDRAAETMEKVQKLARDFLDQKIAEARERRENKTRQPPEGGSG